MKLLVLLVVLALRRMDIDWPDWLVSRDRFRQALAPLDARLTPLTDSVLLQWLAQVLAPAVLVGLLLGWVSGWLFGLVGLLLSGLLLLWLIGAESEFRHLDEMLMRGRMDDPEHLAEAAEEHFGVGSSPDDQGYFPALLRRITRQDLLHLFATIFWLITLGYGVAMLYVLNRHWLDSDNTGRREFAALLHTALIWLPARLLVLCMALAGNFGRVADSVAGEVWQLDDGLNLLDDALAGALDVTALEDPENLQKGMDQLEALQSLLLRCLAIWLILAAAWLVIIG